MVAPGVQLRPEPAPRTGEDSPTQPIGGLFPRAGSARAPVFAVPGYEVLAHIGVGGMGVVVKARHLGLDRVVALKMLGRDIDDADAHRRFRQESLPAPAAGHPEHRRAEVQPGRPSG